MLLLQSKALIAAQNSHPDVINRSSGVLLVWLFCGGSPFGELSAELIKICRRVQ